MKGKDYNKDSEPEKSMPFHSESKALKGETQFDKVKKEQEPFFNRFLALQLGCSHSRALSLFRKLWNENKIDLLIKAIEHVENEVLLGTQFKKDKLAMINAILNGKIIPISKDMMLNRKFLEDFALLHGLSFKFYRKHAICTKTNNSLEFSLDHNEFIQYVKRKYTSR